MTRLPRAAVLLLPFVLAACTSSPNSTSAAAKQCQTFDTAMLAFVADYNTLKAGGLPAHPVSDTTNVAYNMSQVIDGSSSAVNGDVRDMANAVKALNDAITNMAVTQQNVSFDVQVSAIGHAYSTLDVACSAAGYQMKNTIS